MKRAIQVGDRVAVYSGVCRFIRTVAAVRDGCYVDLVVPIANTPEHSMGTVHVRQCRRLIRRERRRWEGEWRMVYGGDGALTPAFFVDVCESGVPKANTRMTLVEARPRKEREK